MDLIMVQMQALAFLIAGFQLPGARVQVDAEGHARIDAAEYADQAVTNAIPFGDGTGNVFLAMLGGVEVTDFPAAFAGVAEGGLFQAFGDLSTMLPELLIQNAVSPQVALQASGIGKVAQGTAEEKAVKAMQDATDKLGEFV
jgi:hypothetical protein